MVIKICSVACGPFQGQSFLTVAVVGIQGCGVCMPHAGCSIYPADFKVALFSILQMPLICRLYPVYFPLVLLLFILRKFTRISICSSVSVLAIITFLRGIGK